MNISIATHAQATAITDLHAAIWASTYGSVPSQNYLQSVVPSERRAVWQQRFKNPEKNQTVPVAQEDEFIVGFACVLAFKGPQWGSYLENLHVRQSHHGRGIGAQTLAEVARLCAEKCAGQGLYLSVKQTNVQAQKSYRGLGAENVQSAVWVAPDGSRVPHYTFEWQSTTALAESGKTLSPVGSFSAARKLQS